MRVQGTDAFGPVRREAVELEGIGAEVVERRLAAVVVGEQLPAVEEHAVLARHPLDREVERPPRAPVVGFEDPVVPLQLRAARQAEPAVERRQQVERRDRLAHPARRLAGEQRQHRHAQLLLVHRRTVGRQAVLVERLAVIGDHQQGGALEHSRRGEPVDQPADLQVDVGEGVVEPVEHEWDLVARILEQRGGKVDRRRPVGRREGVRPHVGVVRGLEVDVGDEGRLRPPGDPGQDVVDHRLFVDLRFAPLAAPRRVGEVRCVAQPAEPGRSEESDHVAPALVLAGGHCGAPAVRRQDVPRQGARIVETEEVVVRVALAREERREDRGLGVVGVGRHRPGAVEDDRPVRQLEQLGGRLRPRVGAVEPFPRHRLEHQDEDIPRRLRRGGRLAGLQPQMARRIGAPGGARREQPFEAARHRAGVGQQNRRGPARRGESKEYGGNGDQAAAGERQAAARGRRGRPPACRGEQRKQKESKHQRQQHGAPQPGPLARRPFAGGLSRAGREEPEILEAQVRAEH